MKVLVTMKFPEEYHGELAKITADYTQAGRGFDGYKLTQEQMIENLQGCDIVLNGVEMIDKAVMEECPELKAIFCGRNEAFASVDIEEATRRKIPVIGCAGRNAVSVAEFTIGLLLSLCKRIALMDYLMKYTDTLVGKEYDDKKQSKEKVSSAWSVDPKGPNAVYGGYPELYGKKFGQIGFGMIGKEVAKRAQAFGMELLISDPFADKDAVKEMEGRVVPLEVLMEQADFISINCNVNKGTIGMVNEEMLSRMKPSAYIINTARAPIMDYDALYRLLKENKIAGAALDVYPIEPLPKNHPLLELPNVVLPPHFAGQSKEITNHMNEMILRDLKLLLSGKRPVNICNPEVLDAFFQENEELLILKTKE